MNRDRIVIKVGTSTLTNELGNSNLRTMEKLAMVLSDIQNMGHEVILVSSGAIAVGANKMHMKEKPTSMRMKQAAAAVGQCTNMFLYDKFFGYYDKMVGQILLNAEDITQEEKKENLSNTFSALLDNDVLSAVVAVLCQADKLVILSDIDGFYDKDPRLFKDARLIEQINVIDDAVYKLAGGAGSRRGTGGMRTKLKAADLATAQGIDTIVTNGKDPDILYKVVNGEPAGTLFKGRR